MGASDGGGDCRIICETCKGRTILRFSSELPGRLLKGEAESSHDAWRTRPFDRQSLPLTTLHVEEIIRGKRAYFAWLKFDDLGFFQDGHYQGLKGGRVVDERYLTAPPMKERHLRVLEALEDTVKRMEGVHGLPRGIANLSYGLRHRRD